MMFVLIALCSLFYYSLSFLMSSSLTTLTAALILPNVTAVYVGTFLLAENSFDMSLCDSVPLRHVGLPPNQSLTTSNFSESPCDFKHVRSLCDSIQKHCPSPSDIKEELGPHDLPLGSPLDFERGHPSDVKARKGLCNSLQKHRPLAWDVNNRASLLDFKPQHRPLDVQEYQNIFWYELGPIDATYSCLNDVTIIASGKDTRIIASCSDLGIVNEICCVKAKRLYYESSYRTAWMFVLDKEHGSPLNCMMISIQSYILVKIEENLKAKCPIQFYLNIHYRHYRASEADDGQKLIGGGNVRFTASDLKPFIIPGNVLALNYSNTNYILVSVEKAGDIKETTLTEDHIICSIPPSSLIIEKLAVPSLQNLSALHSIQLPAKSTKKSFVQCLKEHEMCHNDCWILFQPNSLRSWADWNKMQRTKPTAKQD
ncbi:hypothetical protein C8J56DRAFT_896639 [Mycena floridula]|nr:hypothetical protein C8J56DRAFT_896639 [Mycena floridula]